MGRNASKQDLLEKIQRLHFENQALRTVFEDAYECIALVDANGIITMMNDTYGNFLGVKPKDTIGRHVAEVIDNTRLHIVTKTGKAEIEEIQRINGNDAVTSRIPIYSKGKVIGAIGKVNYKSIREVKMLYRKLELAEKEIDDYKERLRRVKGGYYALDNIVGESNVIRKLKETVKKISYSDSTVLITGESGTGKEIFANAIHEISDRRDQHFVKINCAAIPESILESELFGYEEGAFTGAVKGGKIGRFEWADKGTLFLDEIGDMSLDMQSKILRVIQEKEVTRVGSGITQKIDVRIIAATNQNLEEKMKKGEFRQDLYYRLNVIPLELPPLRSRKEDINALCQFFLKKYNEEFGIYIDKLDDEAMEYIHQYPWPGNIRELENMIERAYNLVDGYIIRKNHLPDRILDVKKQKYIGKLSTIMDEVEKQTILETLKLQRGNKTKAAKALGINRAGLYQKLKKHHIDYY